MGKTVGRRLLALSDHPPAPDSFPSDYNPDTNSPHPSPLSAPLCTHFPHCCLSRWLSFACGPLNRVVIQRFNYRGTEGGEPRGTRGDGAGEERRAGRRGIAESFPQLSLARRARQTGECAGGLDASAGRTCDSRVAQGCCQ